MNRLVGVVLSVAYLACAIASSAKADEAASRAVAAVQAAFNHIRTSYVDAIDEAAVLGSSLKAMQQVVGTDKRSSRNDGRSARLENSEVLITDIARLLRNASGAADYRKLTRLAITGMLEALDSQSQYIDAEEFRRHQAAAQMGSAGLSLTIRNGATMVVSPSEGGPAETAGIRAGDIIAAVNGAQIAGLRLEEVVAMMRGAVDSSVALTILRKGTRTIVTVKRANVFVRHVYSAVHDDVGYIALTGFHEQTDRHLRADIAKMEAASEGRIKGYVLDLRDNSGGLLDGAITATRLFLSNGVIATARGRESIQHFEAQADAAVAGRPMIVLVNEGTAAGAEIIASALQAHRRALIAGRRSAGAGTVQTVIPLEEGNGVLRLTTSRLYAASGEAIEGIGVMPDVVLDRVDSPIRSGRIRPDQVQQDAQIRFAVEYLKRDGR